MGVKPCITGAFCSSVFISEPMEWNLGNRSMLLPFHAHLFSCMQKTLMKAFRTKTHSTASHDVFRVHSHDLFQRPDRSSFFVFSAESPKTWKYIFTLPSLRLCVSYFSFQAKSAAAERECWVWGWRSGLKLKGRVEMWTEGWCHVGRDEYIQVNESDT